MRLPHFRATRWPDLMAAKMDVRPNPDLWQTSGILKARRPDVWVTVSHALVACSADNARSIGTISLLQFTGTVVANGERMADQTMVRHGFKGSASEQK